MIDRRTFVQYGVTGLVVTAAAAGSFKLSGTATAAESQAHLAIFDRRFAAARKFAQTTQAQGISTRAITGDVTWVWFNELHPLWKQRPVAIAGLTTYAPLFCLERLAWDHGMRVIQRDQHDVRAPNEPEQALYSWVIAPRRAV
jgi:hypothetical protein